MPRVFLGAEPRFSVVDALENMHRLDAALLSGLVDRDASRACTARLVRSARPRSTPDVHAVRALIELAAAELPHRRARRAADRTPPSSTRWTRPARSSWSPTRSWRRCAAPAAGVVVAAALREGARERRHHPLRRARGDRRSATSSAWSAARRAPVSRTITRPRSASQNTGRPLVLEKHSKLARVARRLHALARRPPAKRTRPRSGRAVRPHRPPP